MVGGRRKCCRNSRRIGQERARVRCTNQNMINSVQPKGELQARHGRYPRPMRPKKEKRKRGEDEGAIEIECMRTREKRLGTAVFLAWRFIVPPPSALNLGSAPPCFSCSLWFAWLCPLSVSGGNTYDGSLGATSGGRGARRNEHEKKVCADFNGAPSAVSLCFRIGFWQLDFWIGIGIEFAILGLQYYLCPCLL